MSKIIPGILREELTIDFVKPEHTHLDDTCPFCDSEDLCYEDEDYKAAGTEIEVQTYCKNCGSSFSQVYKLIAIRHLEQGSLIDL